MKRHRNKLIILAVLLFCGVIGFVNGQGASVVPFQGVGSIQAFDNSGNPLVNGVLYTYQAGTTTQQATYTDATGTVQNPDPTPFTSGGRAAIWLLSGATYKFVLCVQNDGASCAPGDVLFSVDQVPASTGGGGGGSGTFTGTLISGSSNPATSGIVRLASGDTICWRNAAGSANLCFSKDSNDLLSWGGGSLKFPLVSAPTGIVGYNLLWADNTADRWMMANNGSPAQQVVGSGVDINTSDQVTQLHFGSSATPLGSSGPTAAGQCTSWNGTQIVWAGCSTVCTNYTPVTVSNSTSQNDLQSCTIPANALVQGNMLTIDVLGVNGTGSAQTISIVISVGGGTPCTTTSGTTSGANNQPFTVEAKFFVLTAGSSGTANMSCSYSSSPAAGGVQGPNGVVGSPTFSVNTTISNTLQISEIMSVANASNTITEQGLKAIVF